SGKVDVSSTPLKPRRGRQTKKDEEAAA
ncbi:hypothetical protein LCGC14_2161470, partial [marine sediment metagenome]